VQAYRQTFRRHRALLIAPVVVAALVGAWFTFGAAPRYRSFATLWVDNSPAISSSVGAAMTATSDSDPSLSGAGGPGSAAAAPSGPAALEAQAISQLLLSPGFDTAISRGSLLPTFLESGGSGGGFSPSALLAGHTPDIPGSEAVGAGAAVFAPGLRMSSTGPQVLELSYDSPSARVSRSVLQSVVRQLGAAGSDFGASIGKTASAYYKRQLTAATSEATGNQGSLTTYVRQHPHANADTDPTYRALTREVGLADAQRASVQVASTQADAEAESARATATIKVMDAPTLPTGPVTGLISKLTGALGGAFAGTVMSLLALIALTPRPRTRWDAEVPLFTRLAAWDSTGRNVTGPSARPAPNRAARPQAHLPLGGEGT
jgi:hypothetical protein